MKRLFNRLIPKTLTNRLISMFLLFVLLPFVLLSYYNFQTVESVMQRKAGEQDREQLRSLKRGLEDFSGILPKTLTLIEQDPTVVSILQNPEDYELIDRIRTIEGKFFSIANSFFLSGSQVYYTLSDLKGNVYTSYQPREPVVYDQIRQEPWFRTVMDSTERYLWVTNDANMVKKEITSSANMASLYAIMKDNSQETYGVIRISMDYEEWFRRATGASDGNNGSTYYALVDANGNPVLSSDMKRPIPSEPFAAAVQAGDAGRELSWVDDRGQVLYTASFIPSLDWYVVKGTPQALLFREINSIKQRYFIVLAGFLLLFAGMTVVLSAGITRPLLRLQRKMEAVAGSDLKVAIPVSNGTKEVRSLAHSFNRMVKDIHDLVKRLKQEERQKQAIRFQVLLSQMNPHFLLNTLNTIKSIALLKDDDETHEICISLGKLLESSLNLDVDLIHLKQELDLVRAYLHIQNCRFGNRFAAVYELEDVLQYALVPKTSLQPLVENAIVHGFGPGRQTGTITVRAYMDDSRLILEVEDDGVGLEAAAARGKRRSNSGVGLSNLKERLGLLFQDRAVLALQDSKQGAIARMELPLLLATPYTKEDQTHE